MKLSTRFAISILSATFACASVTVVQAADAKQTVSKPVAKPLKAAQDAMLAKNYPEALAKLKEVDALPGKSPYDIHLMNELLGSTYARQQNYGEAAKVLELGLNDGFLEQNDIPARVRALAQLNYQIKNYDKAIEFGNRAVKGGYADEAMHTLIGQSYYIKGDYKGTAAFVKADVDAEIKAGKTPKEQSIQLVMSSCIKLMEQECISQSLERLVTYYPKPDYWQNLTFSLFQNASSNDKSLLQLYRLAFEVDAMKKADDYNEMAQLAIEAGSPGEAQRVLQRGFDKNIFAEQRDKDKNQRLLESAKRQAAADQASLAKSEQDADKATTGDKDVGVGLAYISYEQYDKAVDVLQRGIAKGGVKNSADAYLLLGIAQLKSAKKDDAIKSFKAVKGDPKLERLANLWTLHAREA